MLLNIGRLAKEKNLEKILRVFPELHRRLPDVQLVIIGEGPLKQTLQEQAETLGVADSVSIVGAKPWEKIDRYYAIGDVFVSASHSETQGLTYIEAAASGLCVCAVDDPCLLGVFRDGVSAVLLLPALSASRTERSCSSTPHAGRTVPCCKVWQPPQRCGEYGRLPG